MADLYPTIRFPNVSFDWVGELPEIYQQQRGQAELRRGLADLKSNDPTSLRNAARAALASGTDRGLKAAAELFTAAQRQEDLTQKQRAEREYNEWLRLYGESKKGTAEGGGTTVDLPFPGAATAPSPGPTPLPTLPMQRPAPSFPPYPPPPSSVGPQTSAAPASAPSTPMSPSDALIAAAQRGPQGAAGPQFAGPGATAPTSAAPAPPPISPLTVQGAQAVPAVVPQAAPQSPVVPMGQVNPVASARERAIAARDKLMTMPFASTNTPAGRALMSEFNSALSEAAKGDKEEISYQQERLRRAQEGRPDITRNEFKNDNAVNAERFGKASERYKEISKAGETGKDFADKLSKMKTIMEDPSFATGEPGRLDRARNYAASLIQTLEAAGLPTGGLTRDVIKNLTTPVALREAFASLNKQVITAYISNRSFSDADRNAMISTLPNLSQTKEGMELTHKILMDAANKSQAEAKAAREYMKGSESRATAFGLDQAVLDAGQKSNEGVLVNRDGTTTALGREVENHANEGRTGTDAQGNRWIMRGGRLVPLR